jgi:transcriptional regulator with XRE-family HTH domain
VTPFGLLLRLSGLSQSEAADFLRVSASQVNKMSNGARSAPPGIIDELQELIAKQQLAADEFLDMLDEAGPTEAELGYPADDHEARQLGMPSVGSWSAIAARVIAEAKCRIILVPRGSTPDTAAAIDAHGA